jgi:hypothetical protein
MVATGCLPAAVGVDARVPPPSDVEQPAVDAAPADAAPADAAEEEPVLAGRVRIVVTDALRNEGLPCKLTIWGVDGTATPEWGWEEQIGEWLDRRHWALGIGQWVLMAHGRAGFQLPPGRYRFVVTRGMEYAALDLGVVEITEEQGVLLQGQLRRVVDTAGEIAGDFHVHASPSFDCEVPLDQRVLSLAAEGIEVFASTDHDVIGNYAPALRALGLERHLHWIRGDEITADGIGHFGVYPLRGGVDPSVDLVHPPGTTVSQVVARARAAAPVVQLNHPLWRDPDIGYWSTAGFDPVTGRSAMELVNRFDAVEVWNAHTLDEWYPAEPDEVIDAWMATLQLGLGPDDRRSTTAMGNSDTHRLAHTPPGWPRTYLRVPDDDPANVTDAMVVSAIHAGDAVVTSGPFLRASIAGVRPGGLVRASGRTVMLRVELQAPAWTPVDRIEVYANRFVVTSREVTSLPMGGFRRQMWEIPVTLTRDAWIVVRTRAASPVSALAGTHFMPLPSLALVNPIFVDVDGDGIYTPPGIDGAP